MWLFLSILGGLQTLPTASFLCLTASFHSPLLSLNNAVTHEALSHVHRSSSLSKVAILPPPGSRLSPSLSSPRLSPPPPLLPLPPHPLPFPPSLFPPSPFLASSPSIHTFPLSPSSYLYVNKHTPLRACLRWGTAYLLGKSVKRSKKIEEQSLLIQSKIDEIVDELH